MHTAIHHLVPQRLMHALRDLIVNPSIRRDLKAPLAASPVFCHGQEFPPNPSVSMVLSNVPALDITHRAGWIAAIGVRTQINFEETNYYSITCLGDQNDEWHRYGSLAFENLGKFLGMFLGRRLRP